MEDADGYFGERVAATYDDSAEGMFDPAFTDAVAGDAIPVTTGDFATAKLDLMARLAGMRLRDRWEGWARDPFTSESRQHVSVWEKPAS
jgi:hypothetical protein